MLAVATCRVPPNGTKILEQAMNPTWPASEHRGGRRNELGRGGKELSRHSLVSEHAMNGPVEKPRPRSTDSMEELPPNGPKTQEEDVNLLGMIGAPPDNSPSERQCRLEALVAARCIDRCIPKHQKGPDYVFPTEECRTWKRDGAVKLRLESQGSRAMEPLSVVTAFQRAVNSHPTAVALAVKRNGHWLRWTSAQYLEDVRIAAKAFIKLGLQTRGGVAMLGFNAPEWLISQLATIYAGGIAIGIYPSNSPEACHYILQHSESEFVVVENEIQLKKILQVRNKLPHLKGIIQYCGTPSEPDVLSWDDLLAIGKSVSDDFLERRIRGIAVNQCCLLIYTSGTTGNPKGAMISHDTLTYIGQWSDKISNGRLRGKRISYLPLNHVVGQMNDFVVPAFNEGEVWFSDPEALKGKMVDYLLEIRPEVFVGVPRVYEKIYEKLRDAQTSMGWIKRKVFSWSRQQIMNYVQTKYYDHRSPSLLGSAKYIIAEELVMNRVRKAMGLNRCRLFFTAGAPLSSTVFKFFLGLNIMIREVFGLTESFGALTIEINDSKLHSEAVGPVLPCVDAKIHQPDEKGIGEICTWGRNVFMGYLNQETETLKSIDEDGWLYSGDQGYMKDDVLFITGRIKELIITSGGENVAPAPIEERVKKEIPIVSNAMLIGDQRKFLSMLLTLKCEIDANTLRYSDQLTLSAVSWCRSIGSDATTLTDILNGPDTKVMAEIQKGIDRANKNAISNAQKIQKWIILPRDFCIPEDEIGPTLKLKRHIVQKKYNEIIEEFYRGH